MRDGGIGDVKGNFGLATGSSGMGLTDAGLVYSGGSLLIRMRKTAEGQPDLALDADRDRMLAMLSVAYGRPVAPADVMPHVEAAAGHWRRGDRALANLRLVFAGLAGPSDPKADQWVALAACLLDNGWPPAALLEEVGLATGPASFEKYNRNHVPAGNGERSGQFDFRSGAAAAAAADGAIVVAAGGDEQEDFESRERLGQTTPKEELEHNHPIPIMPPPPVGGPLFGAKPVEAASAAARAAAAKVGPGQGPVYGTTVHTEFKEQVEALERQDLHTEQSYCEGEWVRRGWPGSVRVDLAHPTAKNPRIVCDLKTGSARLTERRKQEFRTHLPKRDDGEEVEIYEVRP